MDKKLPEYGGEKFSCDCCRTEFEFGQYVGVDTKRQLIFCWSDPGPESCFVKWSGKGRLEIQKMRFHGNT